MVHELGEIFAVGVVYSFAAVAVEADSEEGELVAGQAHEKKSQLNDNHISSCNTHKKHTEYAKTNTYCIMN